MTRLTLRQLQIFVAVAGTGSTSAAADEVALSQSAISAALNELEGILGVSLFDRVGKRLQINDAGRSLVPQARQLLTLASSIEARHNHAAAGRQLVIGASTTIGTYFLPMLIAAYRLDHAEVMPRVTITNTADVAAAVAAGNVDVGFIEGPCHVPGLHIEPWITDELVIVASPGHPLAGGHAALSADVLANMPWLTREPGSGTRETVEEMLLPHLHYINSIGEFNSSEAIKRMCISGVGLACLSRAVVAEAIDLHQLVELKTTLPPLRRTLYLLYRASRTLSPALQDFTAFSRAWKQG